MLLAGGYEVYTQGIVYGGLFFAGGVLTLWADFRDRNPSKQETLATEEGITPLNWLRWIALAVTVVAVIHGLYIAQAPSSLFLAFFAIESVIRYSDQLFPDGASDLDAEDTAKESSPQSHENTSPSVDSRTTTSGPLLDRDQMFYVAVTVGISTYVVGWTVVIPLLFTGTRRPSNSALTVVMGVIAVVAYGLTSWFMQDWFHVVVDRDRLSERFESVEENRAYRLFSRYWFSILVALLLVLFILLTEISGL